MQSAVRPRIVRQGAEAGQLGGVEVWPHVYERGVLMRLEKRGSRCMSDRMNSGECARERS
jgi:hypothetical protein